MAERKADHLAGWKAGLSVEMRVVQTADTKAEASAEMMVVWMVENLVDWWAGMRVAH